MPNHKFRVAICGGGIGGLTLAVALAKHHDIDVVIYEAAKRLTEIGAGVGLWPRAWKILKALGLDGDLAAASLDPPTEDLVTAFQYRKSDRPNGLHFYDLHTQGNLLKFHRADFQGVLLKHLPPSSHTHCSKRLESYSQSIAGPVELKFQDGSTATCDLLIGADGVKSAVRGSLLRELANQAVMEGKPDVAQEALAGIDPVWSGMVAYRALIPAERLRALSPSHRALTEPTQYLGKNAYIIVYPISQGNIINLAAFNVSGTEGARFDGPWVKEATKEAFQTAFANWEDDVQILLQAVDKVSHWAVHTVRHLPALNFGRVAILGDASHSMEPHQGSGAGQAIEDAAILAALLSHPQTTRDSIPLALDVYDQIRRPYSIKISQSSRLNGRYFTFQYDGGEDLEHCTDEELKARLVDLGLAFTDNWKWAWSTTVDGMLAEAVQTLNDRYDNV
ncbi:hypothetical protein SERLADRAFT_414770 [Serpula lacrymans var. lacrymans S7.9]|uniref:FAD-binding domain-containing protein n=1 Tax=Serpula lacrymans var. lacrymans (strain S7.9) TaxID=578457 RepID=F8NSF2_SERL9|nr:uncharacterized protein SERLADRAFT_414770 [Serpula lacrymans var. lacrymans S7.9]EGO26930.1 hypothetical protein SERLADRAFT_414770 [Serpula lacrymans var. lacrymans S7.9]